MSPDQTVYLSASSGLSARRPSSILTCHRERRAVRTERMVHLRHPASPQRTPSSRALARAPAPARRGPDTESALATSSHTFHVSDTSSSMHPGKHGHGSSDAAEVAQGHCSYPHQQPHSCASGAASVQSIDFQKHSLLDERESPRSGLTTSSSTGNFA